MLLCAVQHFVITLQNAGNFKRLPEESHMNPLFHNHLLYASVESFRTMISPMRIFAKASKNFHGNAWNPLSKTGLSRYMGASYELFERVTRHYNKPEFDITSTTIDGKQVAIAQKIISKRNFGSLLNFKKLGDEHKNMPKMLVVAPMSGHYSTLLRGTVEGLLPFYDVYITDWMNIREVPLDKGPFGLQEYIDYCIDYMEMLSPDLHVMAVCQPAVPVMAAVSIMAEDKNMKAPSSMTLIGGPIDTRKSPTNVNTFATQRDLEWFEQFMITRVPMNYPGFMREVYPGFLQLTGFMAMNPNRHFDEHLKLFYHLVEGDGDSAKAHKKFYNEYLSVMDLPAEFYLETIRAVFLEHALPQGKMEYRGRIVNPAAITKTALLAIEGEKDDISGIGQTKAALDLCINLPKHKKHYHLQKDVGHYGAFNGRRYCNEIVPAIVKFTTEAVKPDTKNEPKATNAANENKGNTHTPPKNKQREPKNFSSF